MNTSGKSVRNMLVIIRLAWQAVLFVSVVFAVYVNCNSSESISFHITHWHGILGSTILCTRCLEMCILNKKPAVDPWSKHNIARICFLPFSPLSSQYLRKFLQVKALKINLLFIKICYMQLRELVQMNQLQLWKVERKR